MLIRWQGAFGGEAPTDPEAPFCRLPVPSIWTRAPPGPNARSLAMLAPAGMASVVAYRGIIGDAGIVTAFDCLPHRSTNQNSPSLSFCDTRRLPTRRRNAISAT